MATIEIKNRWTGEVMHAVQADDGDRYALRTVVVGLVAHDAYLRGADLGGAYLRGADLGGANLRGADLGGANLRGADLGGANLRGADLGDAYLGGANLGDANLGDANLRGAYLRGANLGGANLRGAEYYADVPLVRNLDAKILNAIESGEGDLYMGAWHGGVAGSCGTTHCRAGWAVTLAGAKGREMEQTLGTQVAGAFIYHRATGRVPDFFASDEDALADIVACAMEER